MNAVIFAILTVFAAAPQISPQEAKNGLLQGFKLMGLGLAVVFLALIILYALIKLLKYFSTERKKGE